MVSAYGGDHKATRRALLPYAVGSLCARCGRVIRPGESVDLDHVDIPAADGGGGVRAMSHSTCNRRAGGRLGNERRRAQLAARQTARRERIKRMTDVVLGVEISDDRSHTSVVGAGLVDGLTVIELVAYLAGVNDAVTTVTNLFTERGVRAVAIDPHSQAATLLEPLMTGGINVVKLTASDVVVAHGDFLDALAAGRIRHTGQPELDAAVRYGTQRPLGGAATWSRRGTQVDVSPLTAATFACWALHHAPAPPFFAGRWQ